MKILAIVNAQGLNRFKKIDAELFLAELKNRFSSEIRITEYKGQAGKIAGEAEGFDIIISAGGDGTTFEIINGIDFDRQKLGLIPIGTGNSLAHDLGITSLEKALAAIERESSKDIDLAEALFEIKGIQHQRLFAATAGIGFFADVARSANDYFKNLGKLCYPAATLFHSFKREILDCRISLDGRPPEEKGFTDLLINNTAHIGSMYIFREADPADGRLNVWISKIATIGQLLWNLGIITRTYFYYPGSEYLSEKISLRLKEPSKMMLDGESFDSITAAEFFISDHKLSVLA